MSVLSETQTSVLPKGVSQQDVFDVTHNIINTSPDLTHLNGDVLLDSFCPTGFVGIGVSLGTDDFVQKFVSNPCKTIVDDVEKLDSVQDDFIHYQLLRFCQDTQLLCVHSQILLGNRYILEQ